MSKFETAEDYKEHKRQKHAEMLQKQSAPYEVKVAMAKDRIRSFIKECDRRGLNYHVSIGGLDSIVLGALIRSMGYGASEVPFVSASHLEDKSIQRVHKEIGCICVKSMKSKIEVLQDEGFPSYQKRLRIKSIRLPIQQIKTRQSGTQLLQGSVENSGTMRKTARCSCQKNI